MEENEESNETSQNNETAEERFHQYTLFDITIDPGLKDDGGNEIPRPYNKSQMRKWLRRVKWENRKAEKRAHEKARAKERRKEAKAANIDLGPNRKALKKMRLEKSKSNIGVIIDLSFDHLMIEKDRFKVIKQILRCYSINRRSECPLQFHLTSFGEKSKSDISRHNGYEHWDFTQELLELYYFHRIKVAYILPVTQTTCVPNFIKIGRGVEACKEFHEESYTRLFPKEKIVYLTSESENVIENFEKNTYYIIGGLVDHNQHKGLCHKIALEQGIRHGQLPLDKYVNMKTRKVLTIDHVFEIMLRVCEGMSWQDALINVLPLRKGAHIPESVSDSTTSLNDSFNIDSNIV